MPVLDRERRSTAGRRMTELGGEDAENDAAFWGHETWNEDSDNESFHSSDEDSEVKQDVFDSDFDESESDREEEDAAAGDEEDKLIARGDKKRKELKSIYSDVAGKQQQLARGKRIKGVKRVVGHGLNAGIVLNAPGIATSAPVVALVTTSTSAVVASDSMQKASASKSEPKLTLASTRPRRADKLRPKSSTTRSRTTRADANSATTHALPAAQPVLPTSSSSAPAPSSKTKKRQRHTQEELLLEAAHETEGDNVRWLLARKRYQEEQKDNEGRLEGRGRGSAGKLVMQYNSRRGYLNTITFPEMDHVPEILTRRDSQVTPYPKQTFCVITGLKARYRDPRTGLGYYDSAAFKELRRRSDAGEPIDQRKVEAKTTTKKQKTNSISADACAKPTKIETKAAASVPKKVVSTSKADNGHANSERKVENSQPSSNMDAFQAPVTASKSGATQASEPIASNTTAGPVASATLSRHSSPRRRKPSTKVLATRDAEIVTNEMPASPPVPISPSRALQEAHDDSLAK